MRSLVLVALLSLPFGSAVAGEWKWQGTYKEAVGKENAGDLVGALAEFESIPAADRDWNTRLHIGSCKKKLGRLIDAEKEYDAIARDAAGDEATVATAVGDRDDVRARIPVLRLTLSPGSAGAAVFVDGSPIKPPANFRTDPGSHRVEARREGKQVFLREVVLTESMTIDVVVDAPATTVAPAPVATTTMAVGPSEDRPHVSKVPAYVAFGGAGALLVTSAIGLVLWRGADSDVGGTCKSQHALTCDEEAAGVSRVRTWRAVSIVAGAGAIAAGAIGFALLPRREGVKVSVSGQGLSIGGAF